MSGGARRGRAAALIAVPALPLLWLLRLLRRRGRVGRPRGGPGGGWRPPDAGVREPRRPKPSPSAGAMVIEEDGEPVQS